MLIFRRIVLFFTCPIVPAAEPYCPDDHILTDPTKHRQSLNGSLCSLGGALNSSQLTATMNECGLSDIEEPNTKKSKRSKMPDAERKAKRNAADRLRRVRMSDEKKVAEMERKRRERASESEETKTKRLKQVCP